MSDYHADKGVFYPDEGKLSNPFFSSRSFWNIKLFFFLRKNFLDSKIMFMEEVFVSRLCVFNLDGFNFHFYLGEFQTCISVSIQFLLSIKHFLLFISLIAQIWQLIISLLISSLQMSSHFFFYQHLIFTYLKEQKTLKCILYLLSFPKLIINYGNYEGRKYILK